ncbi:hypothetical protein FRB99_001236 [Tulasnella sp. 403]|nr:hypothetical protein FRB99_001236 [Tulasnella sp. 403]
MSQIVSSRVRPRTPSPTPPIPTKKVKHDNGIDEANPASKFTLGLLQPANAQRLHQEYIESSPFKHIVIEKLFDDQLLKNVKDEILQNIRFTEKETDIYKVHQTGDLASLSYLSAEQLALFPSLKCLRDALYGSEFRGFLRTVTGCGPLSGSKQDMSVNSYKKGCHLLNHDDVIGSRRVSYILYLPLPVDEPWQASYGGALELYPTVKNSEGILEPLPSPSKIIPPSWNQFVFFEVQPGKSFHSVEEVVVDSDNVDRQRLSISGWFHKPQEGEEGYEPEDPNRDKSSLEQLSSFTAPLTPYPDDMVPHSATEGLTGEDVEFLAGYINHTYLTEAPMKALARRFADESCIELGSFLEETLGSALERDIRQQDADDDYAGGSRGGTVPSHSSGVGQDWILKGPPHKLRYCTLSFPDQGLCKTTVANTFRKLQDDLFPSSAFRSWLRLISSMTPTKYNIEARRFRPGMDYTLARSDQDRSKLDIILGLTPMPPGEARHDGWDPAWGGWDCYMAPHQGEEDPAVYRSYSKGRDRTEDGMVEDEEETDDGDGTLIVSHPNFNRLLIVLRDAKVLNFVKYVSAEAQGSRWDVCGEWEVEDGEDES